MTKNNGQAETASCPVCDSGDIEVFVSLLDIPVYCNVLWPTREEAVSAARGDMRLGFCRGCTHIFNTVFDPALITYSEDYENSLHFSPRFRAYAEALAKQLIDTHDLRGKVMVDLGCGQGDFLKLVCKLGGVRGIGLDPTLDGEAGSRRNDGPITFITDSYSERYADLEADLVCCRQVLEHLGAPRDMLATVRRAVSGRPQTGIFYEVPNALYTLRDMGIWDLIYEHISYFTPKSLTRVFELSGFDVRGLREVYDGQYLCLDAVLSPEGAPPTAAEDTDGVAALVARFAGEYDRLMLGWRDRLAAMAQDGRRAVIWGAGSKGVSFLNAVKAGDNVACVVDISPRKHGLHVAGSGHKVVAPEALRAEKPDMVVIMNPIYRGEIETSVRDLGLDAEVVCV